MEYHGEEDTRSLSKHILENRSFTVRRCIDTFLNTLLRYYNLDPPQFYIPPGLACKALLKTGSRYCEDKVKCKKHVLRPGEARSELLSNTDTLLIFEKGIQRGITQVVKRYVKANNKYVEERYNPDKTSTYPQYLDANNLYRRKIIQKLQHFRLNGKRLSITLPLKIDELMKKERKGIF